MNNMELSTTLLFLALACEAVLLIFVFFVGRFYEQKFRQATYYPVFAGSAVVFLALITVAAADVYRYEMLTLANLQALAVLAIFGLRLYRKMTGVTK